MLSGAGRLRRTAIPIAFLTITACNSPTLPVVPPPPPVQYPAPVGSVVITGGPDQLGFIGETLHLGARVLNFAGDPLTGRAVTWSIAGNATATITLQGVVTLFTPGQVTVTATCEDRSGEFTFLAVYGAAVGSTGGLVSYPDHASLLIGAAALSSDVRVGIMPATAPVATSNPSARTVVPGTFVLLYPREVSFLIAGPGAVLTLTYNPAALPPGYDQNRLVILQYRGTAYSVVTPATIDVNAHTLTTTRAMGLYGYGVGY